MQKLLQAHVATTIRAPSGLELTCCFILSRKPLIYPDQVTVIHKLAVRPHMKSNSIRLEAIMYSHKYKRVTARCFEDIVVYDYTAAKKRALDPEAVEEFEKLYHSQEQHRNSTEKIILKMENQLRVLEAEIEQASY